MTSSDIPEDELSRLRALAEVSLEDHRGVDLGQIRERLRLTPAERVARLVHEVRTWDRIRSNVARS